MQWATHKKRTNNNYYYSNHLLPKYQLVKVIVLVKSNKGDKTVIYENNTWILLLMGIQMNNLKQQNVKTVCKRIYLIVRSKS